MIKQETLRAVILTGAGRDITDKLIGANVHIVGISEVFSEFLNMSRLNQWLEIFYWKLVKQASPPHLALCASENNIAFFDKKTSNEADYIEWLKNLHPDLLILHHCPIMPESVFSIPKYGAINLHPALLPKYRGPNPFFWSYFGLDMKQGVTVHYVDSDVDTGNIINQCDITITLGESGRDVEALLLNKYAAPLLVDAINGIRDKTQYKSIKQPNESPTVYAKRISNEEYLDLVLQSYITIEHFWHILHSNDQWLKVFLSNIKYHSCFEWTLDSYVKMKTSGGHFKVKKNDAGYFIQHNNGVVYLKRRLRIKSVIKLMLGHS